MFFFRTTKVIFQKNFCSFKMFKRYETLEITEEDGGHIVVCTLNRPKSLNALSIQMLSDLGDFLSVVEQPTSTARVLLLCGKGRAFCSGADLTEAAAGGGHDWRRQQRFSALLLQLARCSLPVIALIQGPAAGGGFSLSLACDVRVCTHNATFAASFVALGLSGCELGCSYFLPRCVGLSHAAEMLMTGDPIGAERAERMGLVSRVVTSPEQLHSEGMAIARRMCAASKLGLTLTKKQLRFSVASGDLESVVHSEDKSQMLCFADEECMQKMMAALTRFAKL